MVRSVFFDLGSDGGEVGSDGGGGVKGEAMRRFGKDLLDCSLSQPESSRYGDFVAPSADERSWFSKAIVPDKSPLVSRMRKITAIMGTSMDKLCLLGVTPSDVCGMLDELLQYIELEDMANEFLVVGDLALLLGYLKNTNAIIRAKSAEIIARVVRNNPQGQEAAMKAGFLQVLFMMINQDPDVNVRVKALGAMASLIRENDEGVHNFHSEGGVFVLGEAVKSDTVGLQRKGLQLLQYLVQQYNEIWEVMKLCEIPRRIMHLLSSENSDVREAALECLLKAARNPSSEGVGSTVADGLDMRSILEERMERISSMAPDQLGPSRRERQLLDSLWSTCYGEASPLHSKDLVVLPGEEVYQPPPDVLGAFFK